MQFLIKVIYIIPILVDVYLDLCRELKRVGCTAGRPDRCRGEHVTLKKSKLADHDPNQMHFAKDEH